MPLFCIFVCQFCLFLVFTFPSHGGLLRFRALQLSRPISSSVTRRSCPWKTLSRLFCSSAAKALPLWRREGVGFFPRKRLARILDRVLSTVECDINGINYICSVSTSRPPMTFWGILKEFPWEFLGSEGSSYCLTELGFEICFLLCLPW